jgi:hypothetical protein
MKYILNVIFYCYLVLTVCIVVLNLKAKITFGRGLGDVFYLIELIVISIIMAVAFFKVKKHTENKFAVMLMCSIMLLTIIFFLLKLTIWRGAEYIWNGNIFLE